MRKNKRKGNWFVLITGDEDDFSFNLNSVSPFFVETSRYEWARWGDMSHVRQPFYSTTHYRENHSLQSYCRL